MVEQEEAPSPSSTLAEDLAIIELERDGLGDALDAVHAELDKQGAPPSQKAHDRIRALVIAKVREAEEVAALAAKKIAAARASAFRQLPPERSGATRKITIAGEHDLYVTVNCFEDGTPGEIFLKMSKQGSTLSGLMDAFAMSVSRGLKQGVPIGWYCNRFQNLRFDPSGPTGDPRIPFVSSPVDAAFKWLALRFPTTEVPR